MIQHITFHISGKVQGVGFRFSCAEIAYQFNIVGFVKNQSDGSVYIEAEGEEDQMEEFRKWCHKGPHWARISKVQEFSDEIKNFESFEIVRH